MNNEDDVLKKMSKALEEAPNVIDFRGITSRDAPDEMVLFFWTDDGKSAVWQMKKEQGEKVANKLLEMTDTKRRIII